MLSTTFNSLQRTPAMEKEGESLGLSEESSEDYDDEDSSSSGSSIFEEEWWLYGDPPKVTLTSLTEANREESTIPVLKQRSYTGRRVISSVLADTSCADLGVDGVLEKLNTILDTEYDLDESVISVLDSYVVQGFDFGTAYAYLRPYWNSILTIEHESRTWEKCIRKVRRDALVDGRILDCHVPPRRTWDLCANRVVPYWVARGLPCGISHAWVDEKERVDVMTPINGYEWPVPMPKDANLDLIRIEMLNLPKKEYPPSRVEYAWLDVLCLRQEGGKGEHLRLDEWKLDVPMIGGVYAPVAPVCYFNGLGRPLRLTPDYFENDHCWFRRAWTLQEITDDCIVGGLTADDVMEEEIQRRFDKQLASLRAIRSRTALGIVSEMRNRKSTKPLDKVAGLAYLLETRVIPIYDPRQSAADTWEDLVNIAGLGMRAELLLFYPQPGNGRKRWRPSWEQVMMDKTILPRFADYPGEVWRFDDQDNDIYKGYLIRSGYVRGLSDVPIPKEPMCHRYGELVLLDATGAPCRLEIEAHHTYPIPDGLYTLIGCVGHFLHFDFWAVGWIREDRPVMKFEKLSVVISTDHERLKFGEIGHKDAFVRLC